MIPGELGGALLLLVAALVCIGSLWLAAIHYSFEKTTRAERKKDLEEWQKSINLRSESAKNSPSEVTAERRLDNRGDNPEVERPHLPR